MTAVGERFVAGDVAIQAGRERRRRDAKRVGKQFVGFAVVVARVQRLEVRLENVGLVLELLFEPLLRVLGGAAIHPVDQPQREHVAAPRGRPLSQAQFLDRLQSKVRNVDLDHSERIEGPVSARIRHKLGPLEVLGPETVAVDEYETAGPNVFQVLCQRGRIHRDQGIHLVAWREHRFAREVHLKTGDTGQRAGRGTNLGWVVRKRGEVVPGQRRSVGELGPRKLHSVAGIPGESHHGRFDRLHLVSLEPRTCDGAHWRAIRIQKGPCGQFSYVLWAADVDTAPRPLEDPTLNRASIAGRQRKGKRMTRWILTAIGVLALCIACDQTENTEAEVTPSADNPPAEVPAAEAEAPAAEEAEGASEEGAGGACGAYAACCNALASSDLPNASAFEQSCGQIESLQNTPGGETACQTAFDAMKQAMAAVPNAPDACK